MERIRVSNEVRSYPVVVSRVEAKVGRNFLEPKGKVGVAISRIQEPVIAKRTPKSDSIIGALSKYTDRTDLSSLVKRGRKKK